MPRSQETPKGDRMRVRFAEADFEIGFSLVDMAEEEVVLGNIARAARILKDADNVFLDIKQILSRLTIPDQGPFVPLLAELDRAIGLAKLHMTSPQ
jgi:hypothetical protein